MTNSKLYKVEQSEAGRQRIPLCRPTTLLSATEHMNTVIENLSANGWTRTDKELIKKLASAVILTNGERVVTLSVVECSEIETKIAKRHSAERQWLAQFVHVGNVGSEATEETSDYVVDPDRTPSEWIADELREGGFREVESAGV